MAALRPPSPSPGHDAGTAFSRRGVFDALPLALSARIARGAVSLGALRTVDVGSVVVLDTPVGSPTQLVAGGEPIASGEIVDIRGRLALRITHLGDDTPDERR